ncbi:PREDICTED: F-box/LRR-repeat protein At4g14096-like [Prunus mume]|uniref:F-box/LRR-repeat protein At4g14096-like n=1 Tax=Prunus mume TaxID=102107 RepID=A0ABM0PS59_PRUMU|nr:PREDICTED: F-box/LRR-repeat protein At4g14096-like [Prunus mume]
MEPYKNKFLATSTSQAEGVCPESLIDRFSNLPEGVAHHILSFLAQIDLARVSCVSKSCRKFYLSFPSLNFDAMPYANDMWERLKLLNYLDRFLIQRGDNKIQHFRIFWIFLGPASSFSNEYFRVISWIHVAARCNVEVLDLELYMCEATTTLVLPSCLFLCRSLRLLTVDLKFKLFQTPSLTSSTTLQCLKLKNVTIDEGLGQWISCSCKRIKELWLELVHGAKQITISSSSLKTLHFVSCYAYYSFQNPNGNFHLNISGEKLEDIYIDWKVIPTGHSISIFAPNLKHLKWIGTLASRQYLEKLMCLEKAEIFLHPRSEDFSKLFSMLSSIHSVKLLVLNEETTKAITKERRSLPRIFDNLGHICIQSTCLNDGLVPALASLLRGMRHLNTFHMKYEPIIPLLFTKHVEVITASRFDREYWKSQNLAIIDQLEEVTVELSSGSNELEFARYILEGAKNLKKMVIVYLPHQSTRIEAVNEIEMKSPATIVFKKRPRRPKPSYSP